MIKKPDIYQQKVINDNSKYLLVSAPAGSGKTFTILEKINYLVKEKNIKEKDILCISFTNEAVNSLKNKLKNNYNLDIPCYTFHKLGLEILKDYNYKICEYNLLKYTINEYFNSIISDKYKKLLSKYFNKKYNEIDKKHLIVLIEKFINLFKSNGFDNNDFYKFYNSEKDIKNKYLLIIIFFFYILYQSELTSRKEIDFNDMISLSSKYINNKFDNIKYIIIDEFQDTSKIRFNLIKSILDKTNASLLVVGDDFQSIYRFTGCDLDIFLNFNKMLKEANTLTLSKTYRNTKEIVSITNKFILKNKNQIQKEIYSDKSMKNSVQIVYYLNIIKSFKNLITRIHNKTKKPILVLGRNNNDINLLLDKDFILENDNLVYRPNKDIKIKYLTIHKSKGLEQENVIVINFLNQKTGFPNQMEDNKILKHVICKADNFPFSEERRLLYVALTRTKNSVYLLSPIFNRSIFIKELEKYKQIKKRL